MALDLSASGSESSLGPIHNASSDPDSSDTETETNKKSLRPMLTQAHQRRTGAPSGRIKLTHPPPRSPTYPYYYVSGHTETCSIYPTTHAASVGNATHAFKVQTLRPKDFEQEIAAAAESDAPSERSMSSCSCSNSNSGERRCWTEGKRETTAARSVNEGVSSREPLS